MAASSVAYAAACQHVYVHFGSITTDVGVDAAQKQFEITVHKQHGWCLLEFIGINALGI